MRKRQAPGRHRDVVDGKFAARKVQIQNWVGISKDLTQATLQDYKLPDSNMCDVTYPFAFIHDLVSNKFDACHPGVAWNQLSPAAYPKSSDDSSEVSSSSEESSLEDWPSGISSASRESNSSNVGTSSMLRRSSAKAFSLSLSPLAM